MNRSLLSILCLTFLLSASTQIAGQWAFDWQNYVDLSDVCLPESFTIAVNSSNVPVNITYYYESLVAAICRVTNQTFSNLTGPNNGIYSDSFGQQFTYNSSFNFILFTRPNTTGPFLYSTNGGFVPIQDVYYPLFGSWQGINTSNQTACCVPDSVYITETAAQNQGQIILTMNYTSNCSNTTSITLSSWYSDISTVNFGDNRNKSTIDITFIPSGINSQMSIIFNYTSNTCGFAYQKINTTPLIQGTWLLDWQSSGLSSPSPYSIQQYNNTYMNSTYKGVFNETVNSYVSLNLQGQYYDAVLVTGFTYDNVFNTLMNTANKLLYSQNGSLLSPANFANNWANPETFEGDNSTCCIPSYIQLTADSSLTNQLNAIYFYPDGYEEIEGCQDFITNIYDGELVTTLSVKTPSLFTVVWSDSIGTKICWTNPSEPNTIDVSIPGQCNLTMTVTTSPPPHTLSASWISSRVVGFVVGLFVIVSYI